MIRTLSLLICLTVVLACNNSEKKEKTASEEKIETTTYYLIRHAEKDRSDPENKDPKLTEDGIARAVQWGRYFDTISLDAVYSTKYLRTVMTASPTAEMKGVDVQPYDPRSLYDESFQKATIGKKVLVVGHSNTTPAFVNTILSKDEFPSMADDDNSTLFVVKVMGELKEVEVRTMSM